MHFLVTVAVLVSAPPSGGAGARQAEAQAALEAAERAVGAEVVEDPLALVAAGWTAEKNLAFFARGSQLVSDGRRALARVELEQAEAALAKAESTYAPYRLRPGVEAEAAEAAKWHGVALYELKRRDEALQAWLRAKDLDRFARLDDSMVRPEVARAFAAVKSQPDHGNGFPPLDGLSSGGKPILSTATVESLLQTLGLDEVIVAALAIDAGVLTYAATRRPSGCGTETVVSTKPDELVKRLAGETCLAEEKIAVLEAPVIVHPRAAPSLAGGGGAARRDHRSQWWRKPWLWVGVVGVLGVGVVLAVNLWPRDATYSAALDFHQFSLGAR